MTALAATPMTIFSSPTDNTAAEPPERRGISRDGVRLLVGTPQGVEHAHFIDLPRYLRSGDLLVVNNSATVAAETDGMLVGRGAVVVHAATQLGNDSWVIELRSAPNASSPILDASPGDQVELGGVILRLVAPYPEIGSSPTGQGNRLWQALASDGLSAQLRRHGRPIAYGYLAARFPLEDYQSVFSTRPGSAEMASAGRPFTPELVAALVSAGVGFAPITLHTGVSSQDAGEAPQPEWFEVSAATARVVDSARRGGDRVIAVGTTVARALESAVAGGVVHAAYGWTERVISPEEPAQVVDGLITGWHNPEASHLLLVESIAGPELTQRAYDAVVEQRYLWHEFGDSCLLLPR